MRKLNKDDLKTWQKTLAREFLDKEWDRCTKQEQDWITTRKLEEEIDREPFKT